ncbi:11208_t:CDS:2 [Paraglomus occultum]|uniref:11208_t:CDS:1 n=1 Tax=Paraglomus occultum TaxID=144539 RepID=A0A9N8ZET2_9GLOM|nr:11208_t:CDS:2 [Paraglomus occultum]
MSHMICSLRFNKRIPERQFSSSTTKSEIDTTKTIDSSISYISNEQKPKNPRKDINRDATAEVIVQKLQIELKQLESLHDDKVQGLEAL